MEDFYSNPFSNDQDVDEISYSYVTSPPTADLPSVTTDTQKENGDYLGISSSLRLQSQLSEAVRANNTLRSTYESHIGTQQKEIDRLSGENNELLMKLTRLETQVRSISLEKDYASMAYKREVEKNSALENKIHFLEEELNSLGRRTKELTTTYSGSSHNVNGQRPTTPRVGTCDQSGYVRQQQDKVDVHERQRYSPASSEGKEIPTHSSESAWRGSGKGEHVHDDTQSGRRESMRSERGFINASKMRYVDEAQSCNRGPGAYPTHHDAEPHGVLVKQLEEDFMRESQARDEIDKQLRKMECVRLRTGAERARKAALERDLLAAQRRISEIRIKLREMSAL